MIIIKNCYIDITRENNNNNNNNKSKEIFEYIDWDKNKQRVEDLEEPLWNEKESVELKDGSLVFTQKTSLLVKSPTGTETIIYRHPLTALFYHKTLIFIAIASFLLYAILRAAGKDVADEGTVCVGTRGRFSKTGDGSLS